MFDLNAFKDAIERLRLNKNNSTRCISDELDDSPALAFCYDSIRFNSAREVSQCLCEYHIWRQKPSTEKNRLIERIAEEKGVKATTIRSHIKVSGPLISEILRWLNQELWAIVILLLLYIRKFDNVQERNYCILNCGRQLQEPESTRKDVKGHRAYPGPQGVLGR